MDISLVGKNSSGFDRGYIIGRCIALDIGVPSFMKKTWHTIDDIDQIFGGKLSSQCGKLADYAFGIGMEKGGHGSEVAKMVEEQRWDDIVTYNEMDTRITAEIIRRYMKKWAL
jgi:putative lipase involved disintegration of autophagic bodies